MLTGNRQINTTPSRQHTKSPLPSGENTGPWQPSPSNHARLPGNKNNHTELASARALAVSRATAALSCRRCLTFTAGAMAESFLLILIHSPISTPTVQMCRLHRTSANLPHTLTPTHARTHTNETVSSSVEASADFRGTGTSVEPKARAGAEGSRTKRTIDRVSIQVELSYNGIDLNHLKQRLGAFRSNTVVR